MGGRNIARLRGSRLALRLDAQGSFQLVNDLRGRHGLIAAHVHDQVSVLHVRQAQQRIHDIGHEGVIPQSAALIEQHHRLAVQDAASEGVDGKVGPLARAVHREQPCDPSRKAGCLVVRKGQGLAGDLGCAVRRLRPPARLVLGEGAPIITAVDRAGGGKDHARPDRRSSRERVLEPDDVGRHVACRIGDRRPHAGSCREVEDHRRLEFADRGEHRGRVPRVGLTQHEGPRSECAVQVPQLGLATVRGRVERIEGGDLPAIGQQAVDERAADEARSPGDQCPTRARRTHHSRAVRRSHNALMTAEARTHVT